MTNQKGISRAFVCPGFIAFWVLMPGSSVKALSGIGTFDNFTDPDITEAYWHRIVGKGDPGHLLILSTCCGEDNKRPLVTAIEK